MKERVRVDSRQPPAASWQLTAGAGARRARWERFLDWLVMTWLARAVVRSIEPIQARQTSVVVRDVFGLTEEDVRDIVGISDAATTSRRG